MFSSSKIYKSLIFQEISGNMCERLDLLLKAIDNAGYSDKIKIALDSASSEFFYDGVYKIGNKSFSGGEMIDFYVDLCNNYPIVSGNISVYDGQNLVEELTISFQTYYDLTITHKVSKGSNSVNIEINVSLISGLGKQPLYDCDAYADVYQNGNLLETTNFLVEHTDHSLLTLNYTFESAGDYVLKFYLENPYEINPLFINETQYTLTVIEDSNPITESSNSDNSSKVSLKTDYQNAIPLMIAIISIPSCVIGISTKLKRKSIINSRSK